MRNFLLTITTIIVSIIFAYPLGYITRHSFPTGFEGFFIPPYINYFSNGLFFANLLITPIIFHLFSKRRTWTGAMVASIPAVLVSVWVGSSFILWAGIFFAAGIIVAGLLELVGSRLGILKQL
jgi:hypothetical protein